MVFRIYSLIGACILIFFNFRIHVAPVIVKPSSRPLKRPRDQNDAASVPMPPAKRPKLSCSSRACLRGLPPRQLERVKQRIAEKKRRFYKLQLAQGRLPSYYMHMCLFGRALGPLPHASATTVPFPTASHGTRVVWKRSGKKFSGTEIISVDRDAQTAAPVNMDTNCQKRAHDTVLSDCNEKKDVEEYSAPSVKRHKPSVELPMKNRVTHIIAKKKSPKRIQIRRLSKNSKLPAPGVFNSAATPWVPPGLPGTVTPLSHSTDAQVKKTCAESQTDSSTTTTAIKSILKNRCVRPKAEAALDSDAKTDVPTRAGQKRVRFLLYPETNEDVDEFSALVTKRQRPTAQAVEDIATLSKREFLRNSTVTSSSNAAMTPWDSQEPTGDAQAHAPIPCSKTALEGATESRQPTHSGSGSEPGLGADSESVSHSGESEPESQSLTGGLDSDGLVSDRPAPVSGTGSSSDGSGEKEVVKDKLEVKLPLKQITATSKTDCLVSDDIKTSTTEAKNQLPKLECTDETVPINVSEAPGSNSRSTPVAPGAKKPCITIEHLILLFRSKLSFASVLCTTILAPDCNPFKLHLKKRRALKCTFVSHQCVRLIKS